jgi:hypothetical protein
MGLGQLFEIKPSCCGGSLLCVELGSTPVRDANRSLPQLPQASGRRPGESWLSPPLTRGKFFSQKVTLLQTYKDATIAKRASTSLSFSRIAFQELA